jgi:hypothetical protein
MKLQENCINGVRRVVKIGDSNEFRQSRQEKYKKSAMTIVDAVKL